LHGRLNVKWLLLQPDISQNPKHKI